MLGVFDIILHGYGPNLAIGSLHVSVPETTSAHQIHQITRGISERMYARHHIIMTVGIYSVATGDNERAALQKKVVQTLMSDEHVEQVHGFFAYEGENRISVDVVPDMSVTDDAAFIKNLQVRLKQVLPDQQVSIIVDHNYSE